MSHIYKTTKVICDTISKCFQLLKKIAVKCGIEESVVSKDYGVYAYVILNVN